MHNPAPSGTLAARRAPGIARYPELWLLLACSALTHFWRLSSPDAVIFDESYYERFAADYLTGAYLFDVHPPLGRLMFTALARIAGISPQLLAVPAPAPVLRLLPATFGMLLVPLVFVIARQLGGSRRVAFAAAAAVLLDNALLVMSRLAMPDIFIVVFAMASLSVFLAARPSAGANRFLLLGIAAFLAGCALSVKWTGASALGLIGVIWLVDVIRTRVNPGRWLAEGALLVVVPGALYVAVWAVHFALLPHTGPGDKVMSPRFQSTLIGSATYNPDAHLSLYEKLGEVHHAIRYGNGSLQNVTNVGSSRWYTWPIMKHPIGYWVRPGGQGARTLIILIGNPVVWWGALAGLLWGIARPSRGELTLTTGYALNFLPFAGIERIMYLYHYLLPLVFAILAAAFSIFSIEPRHGLLAERVSDKLPPWRFRTRRSAVACAAVLLLAIAAFLYYAPFTFGTPLTDAAYDRRFWLLNPTL